MGDGADYLKYMTKRVVTYWEQPQEAVEARRERRRKREPWVSRWFGQLLTAGLLIWWNQRREKALHRSETSNDTGGIFTGPSE